MTITLSEHLPHPTTEVGIKKAAEVVGSLEEATIAVQVHVDEVAVDGYRYLSCGSYRSAYVSPSGVVYKVPRVSSTSDMCEHEVGFFKRLADFSWVSPATLWRVRRDQETYSVVAMPLYEKSYEFHVSADGNRDREQMRTYFDDVSGDNVHVTSTGRLILLDGGNVSSMYVRRRARV